MRKTKKITLTLGLASSSLLGTNISTAESALDEKNDIGDWDIKIAALLYSEDGGRVSAFEPVISGTKITDNGDVINLKLTYDALTGASPSGAVPASTPQTFTSPSGNSTTRSDANEIPLDDSFRDTRVSFTANWTRDIADKSKLTLGGAVSKEYDYLSLSVNALYQKDFNNRNTTFSTGLSLSQDSIDPVGGVPTPFSNLSSFSREGTSDDKQLTDFLIGFTQVLSPNSLASFNYSYSKSDGYHNDPYKIISIVDPVTGEPLSSIFENRPDSRVKNSIYALYKRFIGGDVLELSGRLLSDDWGIESTTLDLQYRLRSSDTSYWQPHLRYYTQSAADFYQGFIVNGNEPSQGDTTSFATADYRLGSFDAITLGLEYGRDNIERPWSIALEVYNQMVDEPANKFGQLENQDIVPDLNAIMIRYTLDY